LANSIANSAASSITLEGVNASYGLIRVIEDVSIKVKAGETVALLGTNGNGKSTLMKCIMGIVRPTAGRIVASRPFRGWRNGATSSPDR